MSDWDPLTESFDVERSEPEEPDEPVCGLCGLPGDSVLGINRPFFGAEADGVPLHHNQQTQIVGWSHDGADCIPIYTTCFRAWTVYGHRS